MQGDVFSRCSNFCVSLQVLIIHHKIPSPNNHTRYLPDPGKAWNGIGLFLAEFSIPGECYGKIRCNRKNGALKVYFLLGTVPFGFKSWRNCKHLTLMPLHWKMAITPIVCNSQGGYFLGRAKTSQSGSAVLTAAEIWKFSITCARD